MPQMSVEDLQNNDQNDWLLRCEDALGVAFSTPELLIAALTHSSGSETSGNSNERLEFLGDSVLGFTVCDYLFQTYPNWNEGELTKIKSAVVSWQSCAEWAKQLKLGELILVGKGVANNGDLPVSILADGFEAVVAAIFLDAGLEQAKAFLRPFIQEQVEAVLQCSAANNYKSALQHRTQRDFGIAPTYVILEEVGPDHDKSFHVAAKVLSRRFPSAWGKTKKEAEQKAAENALVELDSDSSDK
ncbi:MAG: ribonuclease III [Pirellulaceae bacterium]